MLVTGQTIVDTAIDLADMRNSKFIDQSGTAGSELIRYLNIAYKDLYNQLIQTNEKYFLSSQTYTTVGGTDTYALPSDFYKLNGVDLQIDSSPRYVTLTAAEFKDRNKYRSGIYLPISPVGYLFRYMLTGTSIKFIPVPTTTQTIQIWYTPAPAIITSLATSLETLIGGDEYMSLYIAAQMLIKEETDASPLKVKMDQVLQQILNVARGRDQGSAHYIVDEEEKNFGAIFPWARFS